MNPTKSKHSNGPWEIDSNLPPNARSIICRVGDIPISANINGPHNPEEDSANAQLIAAVPDLLEACEEMLKEAEKFGFGGKSGSLGTGKIVCDMARSAIAKARGDSK